MKICLQYENIVDKQQYIYRIIYLFSSITLIWKSSVLKYTLFITIPDKTWILELPVRGNGSHPLGR